MENILKKSLVLAVLPLVAAVTLSAEEYRILKINTSYVKIGGKELRQGDVFSDTQPIEWATADEAIKAFNLSTRKTVLMVADSFKKSSSKSLADYVVYNNRMSVRDDASETDVVILDSLQLSLPMPLSSRDRVDMVYMRLGKKNSIRLDVGESGDVMLTRDMFGTQGCRKLTADIIYVPDDGAGPVTLIEKINVRVLPQSTSPQ